MFLGFLRVKKNKNRYHLNTPEKFILKKPDVFNVMFPLDSILYFLFDLIETQKEIKYERQIKHFVTLCKLYLLSFFNLSFVEIRIKC